MARQKRKIPYIEKCFRRYLESEDSAEFIRSVSQQYTEPTLARLAQSDRRGTRRAAVMALGFIGSFATNRTLGKALRDRDRAVRLLAENGIRSVWNRAAGEWANRRVEAIAWLNYSFQFDRACLASTQLIQDLPSFAEAWNQRALARYGMGHFRRSIKDCRQTLKLNRYHFLAASGMGNCYLQQQDAENALECFRKALKLNPGMEGVRAQIDQLQRTSG